MSAPDTVVAFMQAINDHDVDRIVAFCSDDHRLVDAHGEVGSAEELAAAWAGYFRFMPHYGVEAETIVAVGETVAVFGWAWGGLDAADPGVKSWRRPCAWRASVRDGLVSLWQVYVDTKAVFDLL
jgi:ketosteroid isomerase-like protein